MELKQGYKQADVGVIPDDWDVKTLGDIFEITSSKRVFQSDWKSRGIPFYRARELAVLGETGSVENDLFITEELYENFKRAYGVPAAGDMLVTGVGTLGKTYVVAPNHEFYFKDGNIIWFKIGEKFSAELLRQLYLTPLVIKQIEEGSAGTTVGTYTITAAKRTQIPVPPLCEQSSIATALSDVDALLSGLDKLIAKKRDLKQGGMQQLLTGKTRLPGFVGEWEIRRLKDIAPLQRGFDLPTSTLQRGEYPVVYSNGILNYHAEYQVEGPGVVTGRSGTIGSVTYVEGRYWPHNTALWVTNFKGNSPRFVYCLYKFIGLDRFATGSGVPTLNRNDVHAFEIGVPPTMEEQSAIADVLSDMDAELAVLEAQREKTRLLKQGMMQELLTGKTRLVS
ncbi:restriction endonuclease subunit S [Paraburkholderia megapolitana]|uniref:restriction endonuclease subunit S n=1 Tax=Paraburkholderia megapolitana TaxID=420953 RepID=UPI0038B9153C